MSTIHVVPGQITCKNRNYASVWDLSSASTELTLEMPMVEFSPSETLGSLPMQASRPELSLQALATEREVEGTIGFAYQVTSHYPTRYLQPGILTEELLVSTARFPCSKATTCSDDPSMTCYLRRSGWDFMDNGHDSWQEDILFNNNGAFLLWTTPDPISKLLAIEGCRINSWSLTGNAKAASLILMRSEQCMACLARYWQESKETLIWEQSTYIDSKRTGPRLRHLPCFIHII